MIVFCIINVSWRTLTAHSVARLGSCTTAGAAVIENESTNQNQELRSAVVYGKEEEEQQCLPSP